MSETFQGNYEEIKGIEGNSENKTISSLSDGKNKVQEKATQFYLSNKDNPENIKGLKELIQHQDEDRSKLQDSISEQTRLETTEELDKEALTNEAKIMLYEKIGIDENQNNNSIIENFLKGFVDEALIGNYDLVIEIYNTGGKVILESLKQLATWDGLKQIAVSLGESVWDLLSGNAYEKGKSFAELGLITTGVGVSALIGKKGFKIGMKQLAKRRLIKERIVESGDVKNIIGDVNKQVENILPKKQLDFKKGVLDSLPENIRNTELDINYYDTDIKLDGLKERLGLDKKASVEEIDLVYRLKMQEALALYRKKGRENLLRIGNELVEDLKKLGVENPGLEIRKEIRRLKGLKKDEEIIIITGFEKASKAKIEEFGLKSSYQLNDVPFNGRKKYINMRENVDNGLNIFGLDVKYATIIIEKKDFDFLVKNYEYDNYIKHSFKELEGKSGVTYYDSILGSRPSGNGLDTQMLDFDYVLETQALLNIEKKYNKIGELDELPESKRIGKLLALKTEAIEQNGLKKYLNNGEVNPNHEMMTGIQPFLEVQIFGKVGQNKEIFNIPRNLKTNN